MWTSRIIWLCVTLMYLVCITESVVVPPPYRRLDPLDHAEMSLKAASVTDGKHVIHSFSPSVLPTPSSNRSFQPTLQRCCQTGKRVAKKMMVCDITILAVVRKYDYERIKNSTPYSNKQIKRQKKNRLNKLSEKIAKCSAVHPKHFMKCCNKEEEYSKRMKKCELKPKRQKRRCKQIIKKKFS